MGTEVHSKTCLPGLYSFLDLNLDAGNGSRSLYHNNRNLKSGQPYNIFLSRAPIDGFLGYEREFLRQTILKHESIFRHQLHELHRLYKIQRDLIKEAKRKELHKLKPESSSSFFQFIIPSEDDKKTWHIQNFSFADSAYVRPSMSGTDSIRSHFSSIKGKSMQSHPMPLPNVSNSKDSEPSELKCQKLQRRLLDLELPADKYINYDEEQPGEIMFELSTVSYPSNRSCQLGHGRGVILSPGSGVNSECDVNAVKSNSYCRETCGLTELNQPIVDDEASVSACVDMLGGITCSRVGIQRQVLSLNSDLGFQCLAEEFSQNTLNGEDGRVYLNNLPLENERNQKEWLSCKFEAEQTKSSRTEPSFLLSGDEINTELLRKKTIFGVEIFEREHGLSVAATHAPSLGPPVPKSSMVHSESSSVSCCRRIPCSLSQNTILVPGNRCFKSTGPLSNSAKTLMQSPEFIRDGFHLNGISRRIPTFRAEVSHQNDLYHGSLSATKKVQACCPSVHYSNGINENSYASEQLALCGSLAYVDGLGIDVKPVKDINMGSGHGYGNEVISRECSVFADGSNKLENPIRELPLLRAKPHCNGKSTEQRESSYDMTLDYLKKYAGQVANKTKMGNDCSLNLIQDFRSATCPPDAQQKTVELGDVLHDRKIFGVPIFCKPHILKDLSYPRSPSKPTCLSSSIDSVSTGKVGLLNNDVDDTVCTRLINDTAGLRQHIDLNLRIIDEETAPTPSSPRSLAKIVTAIDLEAPVILETEEGTTPSGESPETPLKNPSKLAEDGCGVSHEEFIREAAEAILAISMSHVQNIFNGANCLSSGAFVTNSLYWFAEAISSYNGDIENDVDAVFPDKDDISLGKFIPKGIDYFEFMTLKLTETKIEEYCCQFQALKYQEDEVTTPKRRGRGQARRGRQRRDFQRDVLPGLVSLSKHEVNEDLQTIEALFRATGCTWQSALGQRNAAKGSGGRGRRHSGGSAPSPAVTAVCTPSIEQPNHREVRLEEKSLTGWGKRTRRPPRQ